ncbi:acyltransferase [Leptolyngbya sp. FACHB-261]|uniref:acyltransferase family protein n=1 Tax=Leptolyngbya sp. FACHB-261 TaxID=2692806 RepID=UPI001686E95D|nr:acyltransferase [Leptolyngbya sp. FACHB-261]MBD2102739.1 acyltransferase [Leptolyngbya sp. FACHB-261]
MTAAPRILKSVRLAWLEGIRGFAVILILLYHSQLLFTDYAFTPKPTGLSDNLEQLRMASDYLGAGFHAWLSIPGWFGFQFVDVFVLISGFSLALSLQTKPLPPIAFLKQRLMRLLRPFWTVAWLAYPILWLIGTLTNSYSPDAWHSFAGITFPLSTDYRGSLLLPTSGSWWFMPLIFSFTLLFPWLWKLLHRWGLYNLLLASTLLTLAYRLLAVYCLGGHPTYVLIDTPAAEQPFQLFLAKLSTFVLSMTVAHRYCQGKGPLFWSQPQAFVVGLVLYSLGFVGQFSRLGWVVAELLLPLGLTLLCMVVTRLLCKWSPLQHFMRWLGGHSYSYFLIHNFVVDRTLNLVVRGELELYYQLLPVMVLVTLALAVLADRLKPLLKRSSVTLIRHIDNYFSRSESSHLASKTSDF